MHELSCDYRLQSQIGNNEALPDNMCSECAQASVLRWVSSLPNLGPDNYPLCVPLDLGRWAIWDRDPASPVLVYPKSMVAVVIQQWVEEEVEDVAKVFRQHQVSLKAAIDHTRQLLSDNTQDDLIEAKLLNDIQGLLTGTGLPVTLGMARWLLSETQPDHPFSVEDTRPTRGILVTSIGLNQSDQLRDTDIASKQRGRIVPEMLHFLSWSSPWGSEALAKRAEKCGRTHAAWWRNQGKTLPIVTLSGRPAGGEDAELEADITAYFAGEIDKEQILDRQMARLLPADAQQKAAIRKSTQDTIRNREKKLSR